MPEELRLCYINDGRAYFSRNDPTEVWGDDWDDRPYEYNAGPPYGDCEVVYFDGEFKEPYHGHTNSPWCVRDINMGAVAWLRNPPWVDETLVIHAGTTLHEFIDTILRHKGRIWTEYKGE